MMAVVLTSMGAGIIISITGHYYPFLVFGPAFTPIGGGLLYTVTQFTSTAKLVGYQILLGSGVGLAFQNTVRLFLLFLSSSFLADLSLTLNSTHAPTSTPSTNSPGHCRPGRASSKPGPCASGHCTCNILSTHRWSHRDLHLRHALQQPARL
jgi:hypothetical protein